VYPRNPFYKFYQAESPFRIVANLAARNAIFQGITDRVFHSVNAAVNKFSVAATSTVFGTGLAPAVKARLRYKFRKLIRSKIKAEAAPFSSCPVKSKQTIETGFAVRFPAINRNCFGQSFALKTAAALSRTSNRPAVDNRFFSPTLTTPKGHPLMIVVDTERFHKRQLSGLHILYDLPERIIPVNKSKTASICL
jgi:hypothetical protein